MILCTYSRIIHNYSVQLRKEEELHTVCLFTENWNIMKENFENVTVKCFYALNIQLTNCGSLPRLTFRLRLKRMRWNVLQWQYRILQIKHTYTHFPHCCISRLMHLSPSTLARLPSNRWADLTQSHCRTQVTNDFEIAARTSPNGLDQGSKWGSGVHDKSMQRFHSLHC